MFATGLDSVVSWAGKPYPEIRTVGDRDGSIVVVPVGSVEQHGHHLPVATDSILAEAVGTEGASRAAADDVPVLVTPPVWTGYSPHHLPFGGTITVEHGTLVTLLEEVADAVLENDFDAVLLLNGHGGNASLIESATSTIGVGHPDTEVLGLTYFDLAETFIDDVRESDPGGMAHGGEFETSLLLDLHPELVREGRIEGSLSDETYQRAAVDLFGTGPLSVYRSFDEYSESGAIGAPELASAEKGAEIFDRLADEVADLLRSIHHENEEESETVCDTHDE
ncbi:creatininase family protein [Halorussus salinisoli]|uniref:creatininase family protein n=1 Tax=Halorussus salinisoli TaxID=2558242 RepID=UPI0010C1EEDF|nr:creatininase family protein [Halorussus salinisoli]